MTAPLGDVGRDLGRFRGDAPGPTLLVVAAVHGNEPAGVHAARSVLSTLAAERRPMRGELRCLVGNLGALRAAVRYRAKDLNRAWTAERMKELAASSIVPIWDEEDEEQAELFEAIEDARDEARGPVHLLDLHTTSGHGPPFALVGPTEASRAFAGRFPLTRVAGLVERLDGTLPVATARLGVASLVVECGQNEDPASVETARAAIWLALGAAGLVAADLPRVEDARRSLESARGDLPLALETAYRHAIGPDDRFVMRPGFRSFQRVAKGEHLAHDARGEVRSPQDGWLLMPLYQGSGSDGFFLADAR